MGSSIRALTNVVRGLLIGIVEIIPGVSGGTLALIVGVYHTVISAASRIVSSFVFLWSSKGRAQIPRELASVRWVIVIPVLVGMFAGIFLGASIVEPLIVERPVETRALFAGLILASLWVPITMVGKGWSLRMVGLAGLAAAASFLLTGLPVVANASESLFWVAPVAAIAVCALVLPGVSGSFLLVTLGMYESTLGAVNDRDFAYLGVFVLGAIIGLGLFVRVLQWLLEHYRVMTLVVMTGLMAGSLRALWPWQGGARELLPIPDGSASVWAWTASGVVVVVLVVLVERFVQSRVHSRPIR